MSLGTIDETMAQLPNRIPFIAKAGSGSKACSANTSTTVLSFTLEEGDWLVLSFMDLSTSISGNQYNHSIGISGLSTHTVRSTSAGGGGSVNWLRATLTETKTVVISTYVPAATTAREQYIAIKFKS